MTSYSYRYVVCAVCFGIQAIGIGLFVTYGVFFNSLSQEFGWSRAIISGASSLAFFLMGLLGILVGKLSDKTGPRPAMIITSCLIGLGLFLTSKVESILQLYLFYGVIVGFGLSSIDVIALTTIARWFVRKRGMATGIVKIGTGVGQLTVPMFASLLIVNLGWRNAYVILGMVVSIGLLGISLFLQREPDKNILSKGSEPGADLTTMNTSLTFSQASRTAQFWIICLVNFIVVYCLLIVLVHIVPFALDMKISATRSAAVISIIGGVSMLGRFLTGLFIDRYDSRKAMILCFILLVTTLLWLQFTDSIWMLYTFAAFYGIAHGGFFTSISPIAAEHFGTGAHGVIFGFIVFSGCVGGSIGPVLAGYIFDMTGSYASAFWLSIAIALVGLMLIVTLKPIRDIQSFQ